MLKKTKKNQYELKTTFKTSPNIGIIKYWGKWHEEEIIPLNDNIGVTLNIDDMYTITTVKLTPKVDKPILILNGKQSEITKRIHHQLQVFYSYSTLLAETHISKYKNQEKEEDQSKQVKDFLEIDQVSIKIKSKNSFPTGSGLASSSSGLSALALCLGDLIKAKDVSFDVRYLSRIGSGSSCRSLLGYFNRWPGVSVENLNKSDDQQIVQQESKRCLPIEIEQSRWMEQCTSIMILVDQNNGEKDVLTSEGQQRTWNTSQFIHDRVERCVPQHVAQIMQAFTEQNFNKVMEIIMRDSNNFHATCMDTYPPLFYMKDFSFQVVKMVHDFNKSSNLHVGYTFDAGSHAVLLIHNQVLLQFLGHLSRQYDFSKIELNQKLKDILQSIELNKNTVNRIESKLIDPSQIILTGIGQGPVKCI